MIDIHAHILPGIDDGSRDMEESLQMLEMASRQRIQSIIATPHFRAGGRCADGDTVYRKLEELKREAQLRNISVELYPGHELMYGDGLLEALKTKTALTLAGSRYILVEFFPEVSMRDLYQAVRGLRQAGYLPILAHIERYGCLRKEGELEQLKDLDCKLQMNWSALSGSALEGLWNPDVRWSRKQVQNGMVDFLATDMHRIDHRPPDTDSAVRWLERHAGRRAKRKLTQINPRRLLG